MRVGTLRMWASNYVERMGGNEAHDVEIVHFSFLEVAVATARVVERVQRVPPVV